MVLDIHDALAKWLMMHTGGSTAPIHGRDLLDQLARIHIRVFFAFAAAPDGRPAEACLTAYSTAAVTRLSGVLPAMRGLRISRLSMDVFQRAPWMPPETRRMVFEEVCGMSYLTHLRLAGWSQTPALGSLTALRSLELVTDNGGIQRGTLAVSSLSGLSGLTRMCLLGWRLSSLDVTLATSRLTALASLSMEACSLPQLPAVVTTLPLTELRLNNNGNLGFMSNVFERTLLGLTLLERLEMMNCGLSRLPGGLSELTALTDLRLNGNGGVERLENFPPFLRHLDVTGVGEVYTYAPLSSLSAHIPAIAEVRRGKPDAFFWKANFEPSLLAWERDLLVMANGNPRALPPCGSGSCDSAPRVGRGKAP